MENRSYFIEAKSRNPHQTLAAEEYLVSRVQSGQTILYLYTHDPSVIIGRNQNAWAECRREKLQEDGGVLARRISGGGAVYHDPENLNFSFITRKEEYNQNRQFDVILNALKSFGIDAECSGRNDILAQGRKFSGNAFCFKKSGAFHHGTILIGTDMTKLSQYLNVPKDKIKSKGISSIRSRVINLNELNARITPETMSDALKQSFEDTYGKTLEWTFDENAQRKIDEIARRNASWEWLFGETPRFEVSVKTRFAWGGIELLMNAKDAVITNAALYSDAMDADFICKISGALRGCVFDAPKIGERMLALAKTPEQKIIASDIREFLIKEGY